MVNETNSLEALKLISDWGKWLVTIETGLVAIIATQFASGARGMTTWAKRLATLSMASLAASILAAAALLLTLPEIAQTVQPDQNIWTTRDSVAGRLLHMDTQAFALAESIFFGIGVALFVAMGVVQVWGGRAARSD